MIKLQANELDMLHFHLKRPAGMAEKLACVRGIIEDRYEERMMVLNCAVPIVSRDLVKDQREAYPCD